MSSIARQTNFSTREADARDARDYCEPANPPVPWTSCVEHFLDLALQGCRPGCSSGERAAYRLLRCVVENTPGLDAQAIEGFKRFADYASRKPDSARHLLDSLNR